ncbi:pyridoxamine 5'-phosphate oxidase family protein [Streptomyces sp. NPDC005955]|uniref:pyridoxamine 5'-phosphate oxidase family protein n=1 Tax=Streptomyces sp. NPDC005955 TaxID=3364738 RepID=UPI00368F67FD
MSQDTPSAELDADFSSPGAKPTEWSRVEEVLSGAGTFWVSTVRPDGRPHVTPLIAVWWDGALHFATGPGERKALNLAENPEVVLTTGTPAWDAGTDVVVEGRAERVTDEAELQELAGAWQSAYGPDWAFEVREGAFEADGGVAWVFRVPPRTVFAFAKGEPFGQTRWRLG